ncbi:MAG: DMT family transporter [Candidatus Poseidoniales archaeon]|jgi:drug/metabolite transporter (DMT)-like permease
MRSPLWVWIILPLGVLGVSSAGAILQHVDEIPPLMRASWRLQITALMLAPLMIWQWKKTTQEVRSRVFEGKNLRLLLGSGIALALHFAFWVSSLDHTSLAHSLLFVTAHPLVIICGAAVFVRRPSRYEVIGALMGLIGAAITLVDVNDGGEVTLIGDTLAFLGAITVVGYIVIGRIMRPWLPIFLYATPVTAIAAILLVPLSYLLGENSSTFGWINSSLLPWFILLAFLAGIVGHTGLNACLKHVSPLVISISVTMEPLIGSLIGWLFFETEIPSKWTLLGGPLLLAGVLLIVISSDKSQEQELGGYSDE